MQIAACAWGESGNFRVVEKADTFEEN